MGTLNEWSELIRQQGETHKQRESERIDSMESQLPRAIASLPGRGNKELLALLCEFHGSRASIREDQIREQFRLAVESEILSRMKTHPTQ